MNNILPFLVFVFLSGCVTVQERVNKAASKLPPEQQSYLLSTYSNDAVQAETAALLIPVCSSLKDVYIEVTKELPSKNEIQSLDAVEVTITTVLSGVSNMWGTWINNRSDFQSNLILYSKECARIGTPEELKKMRAILSTKIKKISKASHPATLEAYAIVEQMADLAASPQGSLLTYNQTVNALRGEYARKIALARLEQ
jgi:hypothetical protein